MLAGLFKCEKWPGSSCCTPVVDTKPHEREVVGSKLAKCRSFFSFLAFPYVQADPLKEVYIYMLC